MQSSKASPSLFLAQQGFVPVDGHIDVPAFSKIQDGFVSLDAYIGTKEHKQALARWRAGEITAREFFRLAFDYVRGLAPI